jgi:hypothetical protein
MHAVGSFIWWVAIVLHFTGIVGITTGVLLKFRKDSAAAPAAVFHSGSLMLASGVLLIVADSWKDDKLDSSQNSIVGVKLLLLLIIWGIAFWLRRELKKPPRTATTVDGVAVVVKAESAAGPVWAYYAITMLLVMNFTMGLVVSYVL